MVEREPVSCRESSGRRAFLWRIGYGRVDRLGTENVLERHMDLRQRASRARVCRGVLCHEIVVKFAAQRVCGECCPCR